MELFQNGNLVKYQIPGPNEYYYKLNMGKDIGEIAFYTNWDCTTQEEYRKNMEQLIYLIKIGEGKYRYIPQDHLEDITETHCKECWQPKGERLEGKRSRDYSGNEFIQSYGEERMILRCWLCGAEKINIGEEEWLY